MNERPIVILTALDLEYQAVQKHLTGLRIHRHRAGTRFEIGRLAEGGCPVVLGLVGKGNHPAAVLAERAITEFDPLALLFVGVAGALWPDVGLGDVVVATHVYAYHGGTSEDDGFKARPRGWEISHEPDQVARQLARSGTWTRRLGDIGNVPKVRFGPIAAGEVVQDSAVSAHAQWVRQTYNDALAIEMEAAGVAQAAHFNRSLPMVVVRGISDRADGTKVATDGANWQARAIVNAAAFASALVEELALELPHDPHATAANKTEGEAMTSNVRNIARGHAHVGVQAGNIYGNVSVGHPSETALDSAALLAELREELAQARTAGKVDESTFAAAEEEIGVVTGSLAASTEQGKDRAMVALKKLRGLLLDVADLASKVTSIITAIRGAS
ncbi:5'-methylthioadenosine/S-adenosylhomocysteine nucleosidase family protein [Nonomuraea aurantiaca]|uniref:5'-methylthioadenosine/S-adenosylhomocysteine nucleosidase family protein n=1 Tax=Nonomuraea aurantiaca TaxID=2878562 RepID=UPI001CD98BFD|nr:5'-methylthioadenosine/S-adenosylhomocysteine nucleosidase [Nonomuraea aurantiaca]MCA2230483.1 5'-methylthioadenosine/S-adenosylhomocysteine nucleosidase [Nonomuraea aurantiaca]